MMLKRLGCILLLTLLWIGAASAQNKPPYFFNVPGTAITRPANTTQYAASATICQSASTVCVPGTATIANAPNGGGFLNHVLLFKSSATVTSASFIVWMFSAPPILASPTQEDATSYTGPRTADAGNFIGSAACSTANLTSDTADGVWFECTLSNPNTAGALVFGTSGTAPSVIYFLIATAAGATYTPGSAEQFTPWFSGFYE